MDRAEWLDLRRSGIGGSDAPAICGLDPFRPAMHVYLSKLGDAPETEETEAMKWGHRLEDDMAEAYTERTGHALELLAATNAIVRHPERKWQLASLDARRVNTDRRSVQFKTTNAFTGSKQWGREEEGADALPEHVLLQVTHEMIVAQVGVCDVAVLIGGQSFRVYEDIELSPRLADRLTEIEWEFWQRVESRLAPEPDWTHPKTPALVRSLYGVDEGAEIQLAGEEWLDLVRQYEEANAHSKAHDLTADRCKARLLWAMKAAAVARLDDGTELHRKAKRGYSVKAHDVAPSVTFRVKHND